MQLDSELTTKSGNLRVLPEDAWFRTTCVSDMEYFIKNVSVIKGQEVRPDLIGSIITHYASKWIPELGGCDDDEATIAGSEESPESVTASWTKKRFVIESLVGILPPEKDSIPCNFVLRLLRLANMVKVDPACCSELERRASRQLDQASLKELMIPCFSHTATTLLDVKLVIRLVKRFVGCAEDGGGGAAAAGGKSGVMMMKVGRLVDSYLAEAAVDSCLTLAEFVELACTVPGHARATDDCLYRAVDTYLKAHPGLPKHERKTLSKLIDSRKLSHDASLHAAQNERLPVRAVVRVLLAEQTKLLNRQQHFDWSGSLSATGTRSPGLGVDLPGRCLSKREMGGTAQNMEIKRLKEDILRLQSQCLVMEMKMEKLLLEEKKNNKKNKKGASSSTSCFGWRKLGIIGAFGRSNKFSQKEKEDKFERAVGIKHPVEIKAKVLSGKSSNRRRTMS